MMNPYEEQLLLKKSCMATAREVVRSGKNLAVSGPEGSGKTSFIRALAVSLSAEFNTVVYYPCQTAVNIHFQFSSNSLILIDDIHCADVKVLRKIFQQRSFSEEKTVIIAGVSNNTNTTVSQLIHEFFPGRIQLYGLYEGEYISNLRRFLSCIFSRKFQKFADISNIPFPDSGNLRKFRQNIESAFCNSSEKTENIMVFEDLDFFDIFSFDNVSFCGNYLFLDQKPEILILTEISKSVEMVLLQKKFSLLASSQHENFDIAIADADRLRTVAELKQWKNLKDRIIITGRPEMKKIIGEYGFKNFIAKPVPFHKMLEKIRCIMNEAHKKHRNYRQQRVMKLFRKIAGSHPAVITAVKGVQKAQAANEKCLFFYGPSGTGKTHFAWYASGDSAWQTMDFKNHSEQKVVSENIILENIHCAEDFSYIEDLLYSANIKRIICTSEEPPEKLQKKMRERLFYFLTGNSFFLIPLASRKIDIMELSNCLLTRFSLLEGGKRKTVNERGIVKLMRHSWPENIRELEHVLYCAWSNSASDVIDATHIQL